MPIMPGPGSPFDYRQLHLQSSGTTSRSSIRWIKTAFKWFPVVPWSGINSHHEVKPRLFTLCLRPRECRGASISTAVVSTLPISTSWDCSEILKHTHGSSVTWHLVEQCGLGRKPFGVRVDHPCEKVRIIIQNSKQRSLDPEYHRLKLEECFVPFCPYCWGTEPDLKERKTTPAVEREGSRRLKITTPLNSHMPHGPVTGPCSTRNSNSWPDPTIRTARLKVGTYPIEEHHGVCHILGCPVSSTKWSQTLRLKVIDCKVGRPLRLWRSTKVSTENSFSEIII